MKRIILFTLCACTWAQVDRPQVGKMLDARGAVRTVYGISGSVMLGDVETPAALSYGCSATVCLTKTETSLNGVPAPPGPALFAFDGNTALVWFSATRQLARWNGTLTVEDVSIDGQVLAISTGQFIVRRPTGVWIINRDGSAAGSLPTFLTAAMLIPGGAIYASGGEVVMGTVRFALSHVTAFYPMSANYIQVRAGGMNYALRIDAGHEGLFQLPGVSE